MKNKICERCGKSFKVFPNRDKTAKFCSLYCARHTITKICPICNQPFTINAHESFLNCCSRPCGQQLKQQKFDRVLETRIGICLNDWLRKHYIDDLWTYRDICSALAINTRTLMRYMRQFNIPIRNPSEAVKSQWVRNPKRHEQGYKIALNGAPKRADYLRSHPQVAEVRLCEELTKQGIEFEFQYAVKSYILDFAFPKYHLDIELDSPQRMNSPKTLRRIHNLTKLGWSCHYFSYNTDTKKIADNIELLTR